MVASLLAYQGRGEFLPRFNRHKVTIERLDEALQFANSSVMVITVTALCPGMSDTGFATVFTTEDYARVKAV